MTYATSAWRGDPAVKADAVARMRHHAELDMFTQGTYVARPDKYQQREGAEFRGCFHGCLTAETLAVELGVKPLDLPDDTEWHKEGERFWGIPRNVGKLLDYLFEMQDDSQAPDFAVKATEAIPVGADLTAVPARLLLDVLTDTRWGMLAAAQSPDAKRTPSPRLAGLVQSTADLVRRYIDGRPPSRGDIEAVRGELGRMGFAGGYSDVARAAVEACDYLTAGPYAYAAVPSCLTYATDAWPHVDGHEHRGWITGRVLVHLAASPGNIHADLAAATAAVLAQTGVTSVTFADEDDTQA